MRVLVFVRRTFLPLLRPYPTKSRVHARRGQARQGCTRARIHAYTQHNGEISSFIAFTPARVKSFCHNGDKSGSPLLSFSLARGASQARTPPQLRCLCKGVVSSRLIPRLHSGASLLSCLSPNVYTGYIRKAQGRGQYRFEDWRIRLNGQRRPNQIVTQ